MRTNQRSVSLARGKQACVGTVDEFGILVKGLSGTDPLWLLQPKCST